jgi:hypothetical protein
MNLMKVIMKSKRIFKIRRKKDGLFYSHYQSWNKKGRSWTYLQHAQDALSYYLRGYVSVKKEDREAVLEDCEIVEYEVALEEKKVIGAQVLFEKAEKKNKFIREFGWALESLTNRLDKKGELENFRWFIVLNSGLGLKDVLAAMKQVGIKKAQYRYCFPSIAFMNDNDMMRFRLVVGEHIRHILDAEKMEEYKPENTQPTP